MAGGDFMMTSITKYTDEVIKRISSISYYRLSLYVDKYLNLYGTAYQHLIGYKYATRLLTAYTSALINKGRQPKLYTEVYSEMARASTGNLLHGEVVYPELIRNRVTRWIDLSLMLGACAEIKDKYVGNHSTVTDFCKLFISYVNSWELEG